MQTSHPRFITMMVKIDWSASLAASERFVCGTQVSPLWVHRHMGYLTLPVDDR